MWIAKEYQTRGERRPRRSSAPRQGGLPCSVVASHSGREGRAGEEERAVRRRRRGRRQFTAEKRAHRSQTLDLGIAHARQKKTASTTASPRPDADCPARRQRRLGGEQRHSVSGEGGPVEKLLVRGQEAICSPRARRSSKIWGAAARSLSLGGSPPISFVLRSWLNDAPGVSLIQSTPKPLAVFLLA